MSNNLELRRDPLKEMAKNRLLQEAITLESGNISYVASDNPDRFAADTKKICRELGRFYVITERESLGVAISDFVNIQEPKFAETTRILKLIIEKLSAK